MDDIYSVGFVLDMSGMPAAVAQGSAALDALSLKAKSAGQSFTASAPAGVSSSNQFSAFFKTQPIDDMMGKLDQWQAKQKDMIEGMSQSAQATSDFGASFESVGSAASINLGKVEHAIFNMTREQLHMGRGLGELIRSLGGAALQVGVMLGITAAIYAAAKAWEYFQKWTDKSKESYDKFMEGQRKQTPLAIIGARLDRAKADLKALSEERASFGPELGPKLKVDEYKKAWQLVIDLSGQYGSTLKGLDETAAGHELSKNLAEQAATLGMNAQELRARSIQLAGMSKEEEKAAWAANATLTRWENQAAFLKRESQTIQDYGIAAGPEMPADQSEQIKAQTQAIDEQIGALMTRRDDQAAYYAELDRYGEKEANIRQQVREFARQVNVTAEQIAAYEQALRASTQAADDHTGRLKLLEFQMTETRAAAQKMDADAKKSEQHAQDFADTLHESFRAAFTTIFGFESPWKAFWDRMVQYAINRLAELAANFVLDSLADVLTSGLDNMHFGGSVARGPGTSAVDPVRNLQLGGGANGAPAAASVVNVHFNAIDVRGMDSFWQGNRHQIVAAVARAQRESRTVALATRGG